MEIPCLRVDEFKERLKPLLDSEPQGGVVFDADGTLWSHDVGCMVFDFALSVDFQTDVASADRIVVV